MEEHVYRSISHKNYWEQKLADWQRSGKNGSEWCRQENESYYKFTYWKKILLPPDTSPAPQAFVEIKQESSSATGICLECQNIRLHLEKEFDEKILKRVLNLLQANFPC